MLASSCVSQQSATTSLLLPPIPERPEITLKDSPTRQELAVALAMVMGYARLLEEWAATAEDIVYDQGG